MVAYLAINCMTASAQSIPGWELVWQDEFDGPGIDLTKWSHEVNGDGGGNNELQYYTARASNSFIENGNLVIQAKKENYGGKAYTSARLRTVNKGDWTYGRFEARMKLPYGQGLWPAFWMLPTDWVYGGWAASGEIDIMEIVGHQPNVLHGTIHYGASWPNNTYSGGSYTLPSGDFSDDFHVFAIEWEEGEIRWYIDGILYSTKNSWNTTGAPFPAPFDERFHLLLNVAVGGNWPGSPDASTVFPQRMEVDYVRVYQTSTTTTPYNGTPVAIPGTIEAEDYDLGGQSAAYYDTDAGNTGGSYRPSDYVDIEACSDTGSGYNVGWTEAGEYMKYTVDVATAGDYTMVARVARGTSGAGAFHLEVDGVDVTGSISVPNTGGWQSWADVPSGVILGSGEQVVKLVIESGDFNINRLEFVLDQAFSPPGFTSDPINRPDADEDAAYSATLAGSATDANAGDTLTYSKTSGPAWLNIAADGTLSGMPDNDDLGPNSWMVEVSDGNGGTDTATLNIAVINVNDDPYFRVAEPIQNFPGTQGSSYSGSLAGTATDDDGDSLTYSKDSGPGWLNVSASGVLSGTPGSGDVGVNQWMVRVSDGNGGADTAVLEVMVANVNDAPVFIADPINRPSVDENTAYSETIAGSAMDADEGDTLTYTKTSGPAWLTVASDGSLSGTPGTGDSGPNAFTVRVEDPALAYDTAALSIMVGTTAEPPVMSVQMSGSNFEILWPTSAPAMSLYGTTNLMPPIVWAAVTNTPVIQGENWIISIPLTETAQFFRLEAP